MHSALAPVFRRFPLLQRTIKGDNQPNLISTRKLEADQPSLTSSKELAAFQPNGTVCNSKTKTENVKSKQKVDQEFGVDNVHSNTHSFPGESQLYIFEDNEAVKKMITKGRSPI